MPDARKCPLCGAVLRSSNPGPFCTNRECTRAHFAFQEFVASELGRSTTRVQVDKVTRDEDTVYSVWGHYETRHGEVVELNGMRFNADGIAMGQRFTLGKG